jgi:O-antigen/teichoic acid export membrane protein
LDESIGEMVKTTTRGGLILLIGQILSTFILAFGMMFVARLLGDVQYGAFNVAQSVVQIAMLIIYLGVNPALVKYVAQYRHEKKYGHVKVIIEAGLLISLSAGVVMTLIVYSLSGVIANNLYNAPEQEIYIKYLSIGIIGQALVMVSMGVTTGYERMEMRSAVNLTYSIFKSIASPLLVYIGWGTLGAVVGHAIPTLISGLLGLVMIILLYRSLSPTEESFTHQEAIKLILGYGWPLYLSSLLGGVLPHIYTTLLGMWTDFSLIGNYSAALNFSVLLSFITVPIGATIFPLFSKLDEKSRDLEFLYVNSVKYSTLFGYPIVFTVMALADQFVNIIYQNSFIYAAQFLRLFMLSFVFIGVGNVCNGSLLSSQKKNTTLLQTTLVRFIIAIPLSLILISRYQVLGLLAIRILLPGLSSILNYRAIQNFFNFKIDYIFLAKMLVISISSYSLVYTFVSNISLNSWYELIAGGLLSLSIFALGFILLKIFTKQDILYLKKLGSGFGPLSPIVDILADIMMRFA